MTKKLVLTKLGILAACPCFLIDICQFFSTAFYAPAGTETDEQTQLLMTKAPLDGDSKMIALSLLELDKTELYGHFQIEHAFFKKRTTQDYNVFYDTDYETHSVQPAHEDSVEAIFSATEKYFEDKGFVAEEEAVLEYTWTDAVIEMWENRKSGDTSGF